MDTAAFFVLLVAFVVALVSQHFEHREDREKWYEERQLLLDRIQSPQVVQAQRSESVEPGGVSYVGTESDDDGLTGARSDETETQ